MIIAQAGRRVDAPAAKVARFPLENVELVRGRIRTLLQVRNVVGLVSSAACGADLLALTEAGSLGLGRKIVLPFDREKFRRTSVVDRPGDWGPIYDQVLDEVESSADLVVIRPASEESAYSDVTHRILDEALKAGEQHHCPVTALVVWDGKSRGHGDITEEFKLLAQKKDIPVLEVLTLD